MNILFKELHGFTLLLSFKKDLYVETMGNASRNNAFRKVFYNSL